MDQFTEISKALRTGAQVITWSWGHMAVGNKRVRLKVIVLS